MDRPTCHRHALAVTLATALLCSLFASAAIAPDRARAQAVADEAELHFQLGARAYRDDRYEQALEHFLASNRLAPNRNVMFNIALVFERLNRWADAYRYYNDALVGETDTRIRGTIERALAGLASRVALIDVQTVPPGATIYIDRRDLGSVGVTPRSLAIAPRRVRVLVELEGYEPALSEEIDVRVGETAPVRIELRRIVGSIEVRGEQGAEVRLDDEASEPECTVPCTVEAPPGPHIVFLSRPGRARVVQQVNVVAEDTVAITANLAEITGSIVVTADERDALIEIDGEARGFTPSVVTGVPVGTHIVRVSRRGFESVERRVEIREGVQTDLSDIRLVPVREVTAASRTAEAIEDAPASVSIISREELLAFQFPTIAESLRGVRGLSISSDSTYHNVTFRGLGQPNDYNVRMILLQDGATLNDDILWQAFIGYDGRVDLGDVQRIEVVRGPTSAIYGTGAVVGVVNLVPYGEEERTHVAAQASLTDSMVARARGHFHLRLASDVGVRASFGIAHAEGREAPLWYDETPDDGRTTLVPHMAREVDEQESWTLNVRGWAGPFIVQTFFTWRQQTQPMGIFATAFDREETWYIDQRGLAEIRFEPVLSNELQLFSRVYANYTGFDGLYYYDESRTIADYYEDYDGFWFGGEVRLQWQPVEQLRLTMGGEAAYHPFPRFVSTQYYLDDDGNPAVDQPIPWDELHPYAMLAGSALVDWRPYSWLRMHAGARVDGFFPATEGALTFAAVSPRAAVIVHPTTEDTIKLMGGRAFRAPTMYEQFYWDAGSTTLRSTELGSSLRPEDFYQAELEYTHRFDTEWSVLADVHFMYAENFIDTVDAPASPNCSANDDGSGCVWYANVDADQLFWGGELEVRREFRNGWMLAANYGFLQARFVTPVLTNDGIPNDRVPNAPEQYFSARGIAPIVPQLLVIAARLTVEAPRRASTQSEVYTDGAVIADLVISGEVSEPGLRYSVGVYNLFDWGYAAPGTPFVDPSFTTLIGQQGRTFHASLQLSL